MSEMSTRPRGVILNAINSDKAPEALKEYYPYGLAYATHNGRTYLFCTEGVGWDITPMPDIIEMCKMSDSGEKVDLADLVRTFGARLESNFYQLHRIFE